MRPVCPDTAHNPGDVCAMQEGRMRGHFGTKKGSFWDICILFVYLCIQRAYSCVLEKNRKTCGMHLCMRGIQDRPKINACVYYVSEVYK